jgi:peptidoglycan/xylan/chitin deacetylase (PgdA/CDA1 family)
MTVVKALRDWVLSERKANKFRQPIHLASQLLHCATFTVEKPRTQFESAMLIFSVDVDVGSKELGLRNNGRNDPHVHSFHKEYYVGSIEERALPLIVDVFNDFRIPVTFAVRGQLTEIDDDPLLPLLLSSPVKHDIGAHGYSHKNFRGLSKNQAEGELKMVSAGMNKFGVIPRSFIFPRNLVAHLDILEKFGYECYREIGNFLHDGMYIKKTGRICDVHPSLYINQDVKVLFLKKILDIAIEKRAPLHLWFHPWNLGETKTEMKRRLDAIFIPFLELAKTKEKSQDLMFETMLSAARKLGNMPMNN